MFPVSDVIPSRRRPFVTIGIIAVSALVFAYVQLLDRREIDELADTLGVVPMRFSWPALLTGTLVHDGWIHFSANVLYLWLFGENVEDALGHGTYLILVLASSAIAALAYTGLASSATSPLIGASGVVAAILGVYFALYPRSKILMVTFLIVQVDVVEVPAVFLLAFWVLMQLLVPPPTFGAFFASLGAALAVGLVVGLWVGRRGGRWD
jgi:membrane associated rhomboid family serine protease